MLRSMLATILDMLRRALFSVTLKIGIAAFFLLGTIVLTSPPWTCGFLGCYYFAPPEFFLTRLDATVYVLISVVFLFFAVKQVLRGLFEQQPHAYDGETMTPMDREYGDWPKIWRNTDDFEPVTDPNWWMQPGTDA